jgi:hypothetical protein
MAEQTDLSGGASLGFFLGATLGLLDATAAWWAEPGWGGRVFLVGTLVYGLLGLLLGLLLAVTGRAPKVSRAPVAALVVALIGVVAWLAVPMPVGNAVSERFDDDTLPDILWVVVDGLDAETAYNADLMPNLSAWTAEGYRFENARAVADEPAVAVASLMSGRLPSGHGVVSADAALRDDVRSGVSLLAGGGYRTVGVYHEDSVGFDGYDARVVLQTPRLWGASATEARLVLWRLLDVMLDGASASTASSTDALAALKTLSVEVEGQPTAVVVHLREPGLADWDDENARVEAARRIDAALGELTGVLPSALPGADALVVVSGALGRVSRGDKPVWNRGRRVPMVVRWPEYPVENEGVTWSFSTLDVLPSLLHAAGLMVSGDPFDGESRWRRAVFDVLERTEDRRDPSRGIDVCDGPHAAFGSRHTFESAYVAGELVQHGVFQGGYLLVEPLERGDPSLFNLLEDPDLSKLPLRDTVVTCEGATGRERREAFVEARLAAEREAVMRQEEGMAVLTRQLKVSLEGWPVHSRYRHLESL